MIGNLPDNLSALARLLIIAGGAVVVVGIVLLLIARLPGAGGGPGLGRLPGDFVFRRGSFTVYLPLGTSLLISLIASLLFALLGRR